MRYQRGKKGAEAPKNMAGIGPNASATGAWGGGSSIRRSESQRRGAGRQ